MNVTDEGHKYYIFLELCMPLRELPKDFDGNYYLEVNPDVAAAGADTALHYLQYGYDEGRTVFDCVARQTG